jgi:hypothetical protein
MGKFFSVLCVLSVLGSHPLRAAPISQPIFYLMLEGNGSSRHPEMKAVFQDGSRVNIAIAGLGAHGADNGGSRLWQTPSCS